MSSAAGGRPELLSYFATPLVRWRLPDPTALNEGLRALVVARAARGPEAQISNFGGWQSHPDLLDGGEPAIAELKQRIVELIRFVLAAPLGGDQSRVSGQFEVKGWANLNRDGDFNRLHNHANNHWSGVYYVSMGAPRADLRHNGAIEFIDPRPAASALPVPGFNLGTPLTVTPEPGLFLLFPSWLQHGVLPFRGSGERISIAFNVRIGKVEVRP